jgi:ribosomal protein S18 acetylase RimI-like enzyme
MFKIVEVNDLRYHEFIYSSQLKMAKETEDYDLNLERVKLGVERAILDPHKGRYLVTLDQDKPIACLLVTKEWSDWRARHVLWIHSVYVEVSYRKQGVFRAMYHYLQKEVLASDELAGIRLYVDKSNAKALATYLQLGMNADHYTLCEWLK